MRHTCQFTIEIGRCLTFDYYYCEPEKTTLLKSQNNKESSHKINTIDVNELLVYAQHDQQFIDISVLEIPAQEKCLFPNIIHETLANETWNFVVRKRLGASVLARKGQIILVENIRFVHCGKSR
ncbi:hypothetical protein CHM_7g3420 [Cryptosporidium hominis]